MAKKEYESSVSLEEKSELELLRGQNALLRKQNEILKKSLSNRELNEGKSSTDNVDADRKRDEISESKKRIKHFIEVRFFSEQDVNYLYNVLSVRFLKPQIVLANNLFRTLENQTNKNFEVVFLTNPAYFDNPKYEFIFSELKKATALPLTFAKGGTMKSLLRPAFNEYEFVIQSRIDFDDFIYKDAINDTQSKVDECNNILFYGYCKGYMYYNEKLCHYGNLFNGNGHPAVLQSLIMKSSFAKKLPTFTPYSGGHIRFKVDMKKFLERNGVNFSEDMFQQNTDTDAFVYYRHDFSHNTLIRDLDFNKVVDRYNLTAVEDVTKEQLEEEFGFHYKLN